MAHSKSDWALGGDKASPRGGMETVYFTLAAIVLYFVSDRILERIEVARGARLAHRSLVFFGILLGLALAGFAAVRQLSGP